MAGAPRVDGEIDDILGRQVDDVCCVERALLISKFWQSWHPRLQPAVPRERIVEPDKSGRAVSSQWDRRPGPRPP